MKKLVLAAALLVGLTGATWAKTVEEMLLASLEAQGYVIIEQGYTFLGRLRIVAVNGDIRREIVVNPGTGEILRDYAVLLPQVAGNTSTTSHGSGAAAASGADPVQDNPDTATGVTAGVGTAGVDDPAVQQMDDATRSQAEDYSVGNGVVVDAIVLDPVFSVTAGDQ